MNATKILVPTDFSDSANNATEYAMSLAADLNASILLFHAFHVPVPTVEMPFMVISPEALEKDNLHRLDQLRNHLIKKHGRKVSVECLCTPGFAAEEIADTAQKSHADLLVMGISGSGNLSHSLLGSIPTNILPNLKIPMLVIPEKVAYKKPSSLVLACDYSSHIAQKALGQLSGFAKALHAHVFIVDIKTDGVDKTSDKINEGDLVKDALKDVIHSVHAIENSDVVAGLIGFQETHPADVMVMIPHKHSFLDRIFNTPHTREMVFRSAIPVLALQE